MLSLKSQASRVLSRTLSASSSRLLRPTIRHVAQTPSSQASASPGSSPTSKYQVGSVIHGYRIDSVSAVDELQLTAVRLTHLKTQAEHLHLDRDDPNNTFGVMLKTIPHDSTGVAHILEHTTLCGSKKYPVRDPFFKMLNRSLSNFMNAFTSHDWTMYPFSTQNSKDFSNLMSVYLDAVFFPNLRYMDFRQEGWRLEHEVTADQKSPLMFKGIVYNEMKGVMSDPDAVFATRMQQEMLPGTTYHHVSGGDPAAIPDLTYDGLKAFHKTFYHPSNSKFVTYGNFPLEGHLKQINDAALGHFSKQEAQFDQGVLQKFAQPTEVKFGGPVDPSMPPTHQLSLSFLANQVTDPFESFSMKVLSSLLLGGPSAPLYQSLIDTKLGTNFSAGAGYNGDLRDTYFSIGATGVEAENVDKVEKVILDTLRKAAETGFPSEQIEAKLSMIELAAKYQKSNMGLEIALGISETWNSGGNPIEALKVNEMVTRLRGEIAKGGYFEGLIRKHFLENPHRLKFVMDPDFQYNEKVKAEEEAKLAKVVASLSSEAREAAFREGLELQATQNAEQDLSCLPTVRISDVQIQSLVHKIEARKGAHKFGTHHVGLQPTNGLTHFQARIFFDLPSNLHINLPLFCKALTWMGTAKRDRLVYSNQVEALTGGVSFSPFITFNPRGLHSYRFGVSVASCALNAHASDMLDLILDPLLNFSTKDTEHFHNLLRMINSSMLSTLASAGHQFAMTHSASYFGPAYHLTELFEGHSQMTFLQELEKQGPRQALSSLEEISGHIRKMDALSTLVIAEKDGLQNAAPFVNKFGDAFARQAVFPDHISGQFSHKSSNTYFATSLLINHVGRSILTVPYTHSDSPSLSVLARLLTNEYLHREIREKGGAYGGGATFAAQSGVFSFMSYRDPSFSNTLSAFDNSINWILSDKFSDRELEEAKLSIFSAMDRPVEAGSRGSEYFNTEIRPEDKQRRRELLRDVSRQHVLAAAQNYLKSPKSPVHTTVIGPDQPSLNELEGWTIKRQTSPNAALG